MAKPHDFSNKDKGRGEAEGFNIPIEDGASSPRTNQVDEGAGTASGKGAAAGAREGAGTASDEAARPAETGTFGSAADDAPAAGPAEPEVLEAEVIEDSEVVSAAEDVLAGADASSTAQLEEARKSAAEWQDKYLRLHAEWDTYRRRTNEQREEERLRANEKLVVSLIPLLDDFERTIDYAEKNGEKGLLDGVRAVHTKLVGTLTSSGVQVIDPAGEAFDALEAQAVATVDDATVPDETVAEVYQKGYKMGRKVLRAAMVTVTSGGPKREKPAKE